MDFRIISDVDYLQQRDIFAILVNMFSIDKEYEQENEELLDYLLGLSKIKKDDTVQLMNQQDDIKVYYESILLREMSITSQKYLNLVLQYIYQTTKSGKYKSKINDIIYDLKYHRDVKLLISENVRENINIFERKFKNQDISSYEKVEVDSKYFIVKELKSQSLLLTKKKKTFLDKSKKIIADVLAISSNDGEYGIKTLKKGKTNTLHIFVNGFTNDTKKNNFGNWMKNTKDILNQNDTFLGYDWPSGKDPSSEVLKIPNIDDLKNPIKYLAFLRGINPAVIVSTLSIQIINEWKRAKINSEEYSDELSSFIQSEYKKNPDIVVNLYGHSLGANLIHNTLENLFQKNIKINNVYLLGGASLNDESLWTHSLAIVNNLYNFYSHNDLVLKVLYQSIEFGDIPIGLTEIKVHNLAEFKVGRLYNYNVTSIVTRHQEYINNLNLIYSQS